MILMSKFKKRGGIDSSRSTSSTPSRLGDCFSFSWRNEEEREECLVSIHTPVFPRGRLMP